MIIVIQSQAHEKKVRADMEACGMDLARFSFMLPDEAALQRQRGQLWPEERVPIVVAEYLLQSARIEGAA
jgi:hypothetical protein